MTMPTMTMQRAHDAGPLPRRRAILPRPRPDTVRTPAAIASPRQPGREPARAVGTPAGGRRISFVNIVRWDRDVRCPEEGSAQSGKGEPWRRFGGDEDTHRAGFGG